MSLSTIRDVAFDLLFDAVVVTDTHGLVIDWNAGAEALYGYSRAEILGQPVSLLHVPEDEAEMTDRVFAGIEKDGHWTGEIRRRNKDGSIGWIESFVVPLQDAHGNPEGAMGVNRDISRRKHIEQDRIAAEKRWRTLFDLAPDGILLVDSQGNITTSNPAAGRIFGYEDGSLTGLMVNDLLDETIREKHTGYLQNFMENGQASRMALGRRVYGVRKDGSQVPIEIGLSSFSVENQVFAIATIHDISKRESILDELQDANKQLETKLAEVEKLQHDLQIQAMHDPLTGLYNRRFLDAALPKEIARARRDNRPLALVSIDFDHFKELNDTHGHSAGDEMLQLFGHTITQNIRESDIPCRMGGDEFLVVLPDAGSTDATKRAVHWKHALHKAIMESDLGKLDILCTLSIGITALRDQDSSADHFLTRADHALYAAKKAGRDTIRTEG